ncbi:LytR/AlgR family response regulator transcription factor [Clostridium akagii]|uniref:LytR/AlgR family response regulator transcription factor n=1 Tax=Clostridium akagii TaxID=91623 RepID=UPI00047D86E6|nr:LytTR family DNA-binding domain-containing protein [Clostridium akagii]
MQKKIAICDDEELQIELLSKFVVDWAKKSSKDIEISSYKSAESFYFQWSNDKSFDILLLDIQMPGENGIELAKRIRKSDENLSIIFITGLSDYMDQGYDVSALHYLIKPVKEYKLYACLDKACRKIIRQQKFIMAYANSMNIRIMQENIVYVEAFAHGVLIQTTKNSYEVNRSIGKLEKELDCTMFVRCHRSYLASLKYISKIGKSGITLDSNKIIPVSRRIYNDINKAFITYYRGNKS